MTTNTAHCRHCDEDCASKRIGWDHISWPNPQEERSLIEWNTGHCPMCAAVLDLAGALACETQSRRPHWEAAAAKAEAERIADAIETEEARLTTLRNGYEWLTPGFRSGMKAAARIARGEA